MFKKLLRAWLGLYDEDDPLNRAIARLNVLNERHDRWREPKVKIRLLVFGSDHRTPAVRVLQLAA